MKKIYILNRKWESRCEFQPCRWALGPGSDLETHKQPLSLCSTASQLLVNPLFFANSIIIFLVWSLEEVELVLSVYVSLSIYFSSFPPSPFTSSPMLFLHLAGVAHTWQVDMCKTYKVCEIGKGVCVGRRNHSCTLFPNSTCQLFSKTLHCPRRFMVTGYLTGDFWIGLSTEHCKMTYWFSVFIGISTFPNNLPVSF